MTTVVPVALCVVLAVFVAVTSGTERPSAVYFCTLGVLLLLAYLMGLM
jgi:hypothetical protein